MSEQEQKPSLTRFCGYLGCAIVILLVQLYILGNVRPEFPPEWRKVKVGMTHKEVQSCLSHEKIHEVTSPIRYGTITHTYQQWGIRKCEWHLLIRYDDKGTQVKTVQAVFIDPHFSIFIKGIQLGQGE